MSTTVFIVRVNTGRSNILLGNFIVQYNIWLRGNTKLIKNIKKQKINAKKDLLPVSFIFVFCLKPPLVLKWYFAFFLDKFSKTNNAKINKSRKKDILFANAKSSNAIHEL